MNETELRKILAGSIPLESGSLESASSGSASSADTFTAGSVSGDPFPGDTLSGETPAGNVARLWRFPVKSMQGEEVAAAYVSERGLTGDRAFALIDEQDGKPVSAKNTRRWPDIFAYRAAFLDDEEEVRITLPDGRTVGSEQEDVDGVLSREFRRPVRLARRKPDEPLPLRQTHDTESPDSSIAAGQVDLPAHFFDDAAVHLLTTSTLEHLTELYPEGHFEVRRFRPNMVVDTTGLSGFVENDWVGRTLRIGASIRLEVTRGCPRCVMTTLPQPDLPRDPGILKTAAKHNEVNVGVYARVLQGGSVRIGDRVRLEE